VGPSLYTIKKYSHWLAEFGSAGAWRLWRCRSRPSPNIIQLRSRRFGTIALRNRIEDFEAINTVLCFGAYNCRPLRGQFRSVLDLGANIGIATRYFLATLPNVSILAIEPCRENCQLLLNNLHISNAGDRVTLWESAVGPVEGSGRFANAPGVETRFDSLKVDYGAERDDSESVPICSLERAVLGLEPPVLLKMDVEGAEDSLLACRKTWISNVARMMIEFHDSAEEQYWGTVLKSEGWESQQYFDTWHFWRAAIPDIRASAGLAQQVGQWV
jgi:FkbM family methyltransferase